MESLQVLYSVLVVAINYLDFILTENKGSKSREQNWDSIQLVYSEGGCWVFSVCPGDTRRADLHLRLGPICAHNDWVKI